MLPPRPETLPRRARLTPAYKLAVGDLLFLDSAASADPIRSLVIQIRGSRFLVMNGLNPEPYEVFIPFTKQVWALKQRPPRTAEQQASDERDAPYHYRSLNYQVPPEPVDYRSYWNWDPNDPRASQEYTAVEEREWRRLYAWEKREKEKKARREQPKAKRPRVDEKIRAWYKALGIRAGVSAAELKTAYKKAAFRYHPDRCKDSNAEEMFKRISEAYQGLLLLWKKRR